MNIGDIITDTHCGGTFTYRITGYRDGGKGGLPIIRRYVGEQLRPDGTSVGVTVTLPWLNHFV